MKKILVFGGTGMLGMMVSSFLNESKKYDVTITTRKQNSSEIKSIYFDIDNQDIPDISEYDWIINCVGLIKQRDVTNISDFYRINSVFPNKLVNLCNLYNKKLIHISSDCVFNGDIGAEKSYKAYDTPNANDHYGISKALGEPNGCIVLRTSIIGPSKDSNGLYEWFRRCNDENIFGFKTHYWSGITTLEMSKIIENIISNEYYPNKVTKNIFQISSSVQEIDLYYNHISKYELLNQINEIFNFNKKIIKKEDIAVLNRGLESNLNMLTSYKVSNINKQLLDLKEWLNDTKNKNIFYTL